MVGDGWWQSGSMGVFRKFWGGWDRLVLGWEGKGRLCVMGRVASWCRVGLIVWSRADSIGGVEKLWLGLERVVFLGGWGRSVGFVRLSVCGNGWSSGWV